MLSSMPGCDLLAVIDQAVTEKLERHESRKYARTKSPRKGLEETDTSGSTRYIRAQSNEQYATAMRTNVLSRETTVTAAPSAPVSSSTMSRLMVVAATVVLTISTSCADVIIGIWPNLIMARR